MGDSRAIASKKGVVEQLSYDHKPSNDGKSVLFLVLTHMFSSFFFLLLFLTFLLFSLSFKMKQEELLLLGGG